MLFRRRFLTYFGYFNLQGYFLNCSNLLKNVRGEFHEKIVKTVQIFFWQSNFLTITPSEWRLGKKFKHFFKNLLPLVVMLINTFFFVKYSGLITR